MRRSCWITAGPRSQRIGKELAAFVGTSVAVELFSGSDAIQVGLVAIGMNLADEVITAMKTLCPRVHMIEHAGVRQGLAEGGGRGFICYPSVSRGCSVGRTPRGSRLR
jgi:dTDP-4-amino-4,6-dideoxygalactose transaminase